MLVSEDADAGRLQHEQRAGSRTQSQPACRQHTQEMTAGKQQHVLADRSNASYHAVRARPDLVGTFSAGTAMTKQAPVRPLRADLRRSQSFVVPVVPLHEVGIDV